MAKFAGILVIASFWAMVAEAQYVESVSRSSSLGAIQGNKGSGSVQFIYRPSSVNVLPLSDPDGDPLTSNVTSSAIFSIRTNAPDNIEVRVNVRGSDEESVDLLEPVIGTRFSQTFFAFTGVTREVNTFMAPILQTNLPGGSAQFTAENFVLNIASGEGQIEFPDGNLLLRFSGVECELSGAGTDCFGLEVPGEDEGEEEEEGEGENLIRWNTQDGNYGVAANWEPERVPGTGDIALFDRASSYVVALNGGATRRVEVVRGDVLFRPGTLTLTSTLLSPALRSLTVGSSSSDLAELFIENAVLSSVHSAIGRDGNADGSMVVGMNGVWNNVGRLSVGLNGTGELRVLDGGMVTSAESRIGDETGSFGFARVEPSGNFKGTKGALPPPTWNTGSIAVGRAGTGKLVIDGGRVISDSARIGGTLEPGATGIGSVTVRDGGFEGSDWTIQDDLAIGVSNRGDLMIEDGGVVFASLLSVGVFNEGSAVARGSGSRLDSFESAIGLFGGESVGEVTVDGATFGSLNLVVGPGENAEPGGRGTMTLLNDGLVQLLEDFTLNVGGTIRGSGTVEVSGAATNDGGTIAPGVGGIQDIAKADGKQGNGDERTLVIDGNLEMMGGRLIFSMSGSAPGNSDELVVTGDASFVDPVIELRFTDGYLPSSGETAPVVMAGGTLTLENPALEFEGVADGFDFDVNMENGMLVFEALNDAQALPASRPRCGSVSGGGGGRSVADFVVVLCVVGLLILLRRTGYHHP